MRCSRPTTRIGPSSPSSLACDDGHRRVVRVARHPICIVGGVHHECHVWIIRDVTQQKMAEEMRDSFVDTATHELRTPLANIKAYAETLALADMIDVEQQKQFLNTINSEATRLARFVDDLLSVSSMEVGSMSLNKQVTELHRMLNEVLTKIKPQIEEKRLTFEVSIPEKLPEPRIDKDKIATVLVNLLGNAVKYTPAGGRVAFRVHATDQNLEIDVEDTGVGIAENELPKVFDKFFRSDDPRVQEQKGTGLGLALVQEVVRLHGGRVSVESEIDKGSTFQIVLPIRLKTTRLTPTMFEHKRQGAIDVIGGGDRISGEHVSELATVLEECLQRGQPRMVLDLQGVALMDSAGLELLLDTHEECQRHGRRDEAGESRRTLQRSAQGDRRRRTVRSVWRHG